MRWDALHHDRSRSEWLVPVDRPKGTDYDAYPRRTGTTVDDALITPGPCDAVVHGTRGPGTHAGRRGTDLYLPRTAGGRLRRAGAGGWADRTDPKLPLRDRCVVLGSPGGRSRASAAGGS